MSNLYTSIPTKFDKYRIVQVLTKYFYLKNTQDIITVDLFFKVRI